MVSHFLWKLITDGARQTSHSHQASLHHTLTNQQFPVPLRLHWLFREWKHFGQWEAIFFFHSMKLHCECASFQIIMYSVTVQPLVVSLFSLSERAEHRSRTCDCFSFTLKRSWPSSENQSVKVIPEQILHRTRGVWSDSYLTHSEARVMHAYNWKYTELKRWRLNSFTGPVDACLLCIFLMNSLYSNWQYVGCFWSVLLSFW